MLSPPANTAASDDDQGDSEGGEATGKGPAMSDSDSAGQVSDDEEEDDDAQEVALDGGAVASSGARSAAAAPCASGSSGGYLSALVSVSVLVLVLAVAARGGGSRCSVPILRVAQMIATASPQPWWYAMPPCRHACAPS